MMKTRPHKKTYNAGRTQPSLSLLTGAALLLPGLLQSAPVLAADDDEVDFGYTHYQEGARTGLSLLLQNQVTGVFHHYALPRIAPIEADSLYGRSNIRISDRVKFGFNFTEDTWAGATPYGSAPENSRAYGSKHIPSFANDKGDYIFTKASPLASGGTTVMDKQGRFYTQNGVDPTTGAGSYTPDRITHVMGYASPETRKQGDFHLGYEWDESAITVGGGVSDERDYHSSFGNVGGRLDFNQKRTTLNFSQSYTQSDVNSTPLAFNPGPNPDATVLKDGMYSLRGERQDWNSQLGVTQIINQDALLNLGMGFSRNSGILSNPYKVSWFGMLDRNEPLQDGYQVLHGSAFYDRRPDSRNLWNWQAGWTQYIQPFDAALHFNYQFSHDDWAINAHTFDADWVQPLSGGWTLTPHLRYYSQSAASFYQSYFVISAHRDASLQHWFYNLPDSFSSDQRLSGYGAISGGLTLSKQFTKGITLDTGFEYYSHQGGLKLGGGGEQAFADYDFWVANANLKLNIGAMGQGLGGDGKHRHDIAHRNLPAGLMFAHMLDHEGDFMAGYRYQHNRQAGDYLHGDKSISADQAAIHGCPSQLKVDNTTGNNSLGGNCPMLPNDMTMSMHMLELMYAPTDWLTLMLMPQFMDMQMSHNMPPINMIGLDAHDLMMSQMSHEIGGIGDTGFYTLFKLFDTPDQQLHASFGGTAPTGDVAQQDKGSSGTARSIMDYSMQLGSGTWDFKPSLTYSGKHDNWNWGGQIAGTKRMAAANASGYRLGDMFESSIWGGYSWTNWLSNTLRLAYSWQDSIHGHFPQKAEAMPTGTCNKADYTYYENYNPDGTPIEPPTFDQAGYDSCLQQLSQQINNTKTANKSLNESTSQYEPRNYGGHYVDLGLGISATIPDGAFAGHKLAFEWQQPMYTNVNGYQLNRDHFLTFTWSVGF